MSRVVIDCRMRWLILALVVVGAQTASSQSSPKREFRGVWIATVYNLDWPSSRIMDVESKKLEFASMLDELKSAGINAVLFQVRPECDAFYASPYEPWSYWLTGTQGQTPLPFFDPLEFAVAEAHKRGMELHAWLNPYRSVSSVGLYAAAENHASVVHPEWHFDFGTFKILDPGLPKVRDYVTTIVQDIVQRYDVDGIHFDDYFYPYPPNHMEANGTNNSMDDTSFAADPRGFASKADWRRDNVNLLIKMVRDTIQATKPFVKFGISPFGIWKPGVPAGISGLDADSTIYLDAMAWLNAQTVDYLAPQLYWKIGGSQDYSKLMPWWADSVAADQRHLYTGHSLAGSGYTSAELPNQVSLNRGNAKVQGSVFFRARLLIDNTLNLKEQLRTNVFRVPSLLPVMAWKDTVPPNNPVNIAYQVDSVNKPLLTWNGPAAAPDGDTAARYAVYRFSSFPIQQSDIDNSANLIAVQGINRAVPPNSNSTGPHYYAVTALDRNSNEGILSSVVSVPAPATPILVNPLSGSTDELSGLQLRWMSTPSALEYILQISPDSLFATGVVLDSTGITDTVVVPQVEGQKKYFWRIAATSPGGTSFSETWGFTTGFPATPLLAGPPHASNITATPMFRWFPTLGAQTYQVQIGTTPAFSVLVLDTTGVPDTLFVPPGLQVLRTYYWRVRGANAFGTGLWSEAWGFYTGSATYVEEKKLVPETFRLFPNYPNPFNPTTRITFSLEVEGRVLLKIYDILGRQVAVLVDEERRAGFTTVLLNASALPSGIYVAVLTSMEKRVSMKMVLVK